MSLDQGTLVIVRARGGKPLIRRVWESFPDAVCIYSEEQYQRRINNIQHLQPVCFPRSDAFVHQELPDGVEGTPQDDAFWASLKGY